MMRRLFTTVLLILFLSIQSAFTADSSLSIKIGSKKFTENIILGDIVTLISENLGYQTTHRRQLGGTRVLWNALIKGEIDIYPEYSGTIQREILQSRELFNDVEMTRILSDYGISISPPLGFNNTYAIGVKHRLAEQLGLEKISDLRDHAELVFGFTNEFVDRQDGWPGLKQLYQLPQQHVRGLDHDLAYRGIESGAIHVIDMYSTDAEIKYYNLKELQDDLGYFPDYDAVYLYRTELTEQAPDLVEQLKILSARISEGDMIEMNARAKLDKVPEKRIAAEFLKNHFSLNVQSKRPGIWQRLWFNTKAHLFLVFVSLSAAIFIAIPLGITAARFSRLEKIILGLVGVIQTIPSLALLVFMIPLLGIGGPPAIVALFLYSLLPIVRNTYTGIHDIAQPIQESAMALGLPAWTRLKWIELPLASRSILAGIKTSAVINVGTATLGALIGAGGYGQPILTGIRLDDTSLILQGAVPAALLALFVQWFFDLTEFLFVPKGLRVA